MPKWKPNIYNTVSKQISSNLWSILNRTCILFLRNFYPFLSLIPKFPLSANKVMFMSSKDDPAEPYSVFSILWSIIFYEKDLGENY